MFELRIGGGSEYVELRLPSQGAVDGWFHGEVAMAVQGFTGAVMAFFEPSDFRRFEKELRTLHATLLGSAELHPTERQVVLSLTSNGRGGITVRGEASSQMWENQLKFTFEIDQTFLPDTLAQLETINAGRSNVGAQPFAQRGRYRAVELTR